MPSASYSKTWVPKRETLKSIVKQFDPFPDQMPFNYGKGDRKHRSFTRAIFYLIAMFGVLIFAITTFVRLWNHDNVAIE
jgi:hypothetical protein